jgi:hypothetical protein
MVLALRFAAERIPCAAHDEQLCEPKPDADAYCRGRRDAVKGRRS